MGRVRREQDIVIHAGIGIHTLRRVEGRAGGHSDDALCRPGFRPVIVRKGKNGDPSDGTGTVQASKQKRCPEQGFGKVIGIDFLRAHSSILLLGNQ